MIEEINGVKAFSGIPYAIYNGRFKKATPLGAYSNEAEQTGRGHIFPQPKERLSDVMGECSAGIEQSEDAFELNIWTRDCSGKKPVMFWLHGGAFRTGGSALPCYSGQKWAENEDIVFVSVNYRLGILGTVCLPDIAEENLALYDILLAFDWVRNNIEKFGGDPNNICVGGQSAGAWYVAALLGLPQLKGAIKRAMLFSFPGGCKPLTKEMGKPMTDLLLKKLGLNSENLTDILDSEKFSMAEIFAATSAAEKKSPQMGMGFMPTVDGVLITDTDIIAKAAEVSGGTVDILIDVTEKEASAFVHNFSGLLSALPSDVFYSAPIKKLYESAPSEVLRFHREKMKENGRSGRYDEIIQITSDAIFRAPSFELAEAMSAAGSKVYFSSFEYKGGNRKLGTCHCFDLPFLFDNFENWQDAPMLAADGDESEAMSKLARSYRTACSGFAAEGKPKTEDIEWLRFSAEKRNIMLFKVECELLESTEKFIK